MRFGPQFPDEPLAGTFLASPDEHCVAVMQPSLSKEFQFVLVSDDGKPTRPAAPAGETVLAWLPDSKGVITLADLSTFALNIRYFDTSKVETIRQVNDGEWPSFLTLPDQGQSFQISGLYYRSGLPGYKSKNYPTMRFREFDIDHPVKVLREWQTAVPSRPDFGNAIASPDNRHLLWTTYSLKPSRITQWFEQVMPSWAQYPHPRISFYISDLDGSHSHSVMQELWGKEKCTDPQWTPDSKHLCFVYKDQLYFVPVD